MQDVAGARIDDIGAATRLSVARFDVVVELEPLEGAVARQRRADQRIAAPERQPPRESGAEYDLLRLARIEIDAAEIAAP